MVNYTARITGLTQYNGDEVSFSITCMYKHPQSTVHLSGVVARNVVPFPEANKRECN